MTMARFWMNAATTPALAAISRFIAPISASHSWTTRIMTMESCGSANETRCRSVERIPVAECCMSKTNKEYDLDPDAIAATPVDLPAEFAVTDLSRHPRMLTVHSHMIGDVYDRLVATFLRAYAREL